MFTPTAEQLAILKAATSSNESLMVSAYAGCSKTTTLVMMAEAMHDTGVALAFNKKTKDELEKRFPKNFTVKTLNGLGHSAWGKAIGKALRLDERKLGGIVSEISKPYNISKDAWDEVRRLVTGAMQWGIVPSGYPHKPLVTDTESNWQALADSLWITATEEHIAIARKCLEENVREVL